MIDCVFKENPSANIPLRVLGFYVKLLENWKDFSALDGNLNWIRKQYNLYKNKVLK